MAKYLKHPEAERTCERISFKIPNFEYLMLKATQQDPNGNIITARYDILKKIAIHFLGSEMLRAIQIVQDKTESGEEDFRQRDMSDNLFNWLGTISDQNEMKREQNLFWLDIMEKFLSKDCLDLKKLYNDMDMLQHYIRKLLQSYIVGKQDIVNNELQNMKNYLTKLEDIKEEFAENKSKLEQVSGHYFLRSFRRTPSTEPATPIRSRLCDVVVRRVIEERVLNDFCLAAVEEAELTDEIKGTGSIQRQIDCYNEKMQNEDKIHSNTISTLFLLSDKYRYQLYVMNERYDDMYNHYQGQVDKYSSLINWMKDQTNYYEEAIRNFHKRFLEIQLEDEAKAQAIRQAEEDRRRSSEEKKLRLKREKLTLKKEAAKQKAQTRMELLKKAKRNVKTTN